MDWIITDEEILENYQELKTDFESVSLLEGLKDTCGDISWIFYPIVVPYYIFAYYSVKRRLKNIPNKYPEHFI